MSERRSAVPVVILSGLAVAVLSGCPDRRLAEARELEEQHRYSEAGELYVDVARADPANLAAWDGAIRVRCTKEIHVGECLAVLDLELDQLGNVDRHREALAEVLELRARARLERGLADAALLIWIAR